MINSAQEILYASFYVSKEKTKESNKLKY